MKNPVILASLATLVPATALAHPGDHHGMSIADAAAHLAASPFHAGLVAMALLVAPVIVTVVVRRSRVHKTG